MASLTQRFLGTVVASLLLINAAITVPATTHAVQTEGFSISNVLIENAPEKRNIRFDPGLLSFDWSAEGLGRTPHAGEGFELELHQFTYFPEENLGSQPFIANGWEVGECTLTRPNSDNYAPVESKISCTFDDRVAQLPAGETVKGRIETPIKGSQPLEQGQNARYANPVITFKFNGRPVDVAIPGGIDDEGVPYNLYDLALFPYAPETYQDYIGWFIRFTPSTLYQEHAETFPYPDGVTKTSYTFLNRLTEDFDVYDPQRYPWTLREITRTDDTDNSTFTTLADTESVPADGFAIKVTGPESEKKITVSGPFKPDVMYEIYMPTKVKTDKLELKKYENFATLIGLDWEATGSVKVKEQEQSFGLSDGFGTAAIRTVAVGPAADLPNSWPNFPVTVKYDLPGETKAGDYPDWKVRHPDIKDEDLSGEFTVTVAPTGNTRLEHAFPEGTELQFIPGQPESKSIEFDYSLTTVEPETITVKSQEIPTTVITYHATGGTTNVYVTAKSFGTEQVLDIAEGKGLKVHYRCFANGQEVASGEMTTSDKQRPVTDAVPFNSECTFTEDIAAIEQNLGLRLDPWQSITEVTVPALPYAEANFHNYFIYDPALAKEKETATPADTLSLEQEGAANAELDPNIPIQ